MPDITAFADRGALMAAAADRIEGHLQAGIGRRGQACAALSGGETPGPAYALLAQRNLDWSAVTIALVDERFAPPSHPASNEGLIRRALAPALDRGARLAPMYRERPSAAEAALDADKLYAPLHFDIAVMGMGADTHTASWFPGAAGLAEALDPASTRTVVALHAPQAAGAADRLSLTRAALGRADHVLLLITGQDKRRALEASMQSNPATTPAAALFSGPGSPPEVLWAP